MSNIITPGQIHSMMHEADRADEMDRLRGQVVHLAECLKASQNVLYLLVKAAGGSVTITQTDMAEMKPTDRLRQETDELTGAVTLTAESAIETVN